MQIHPPLAPAPVTPWQNYWLENYPCDIPSSVPYPHAPLSVLLQAAAHRFPNSPACTLFGKVTTYAELNRQAHHFAGTLAKLGAKKGRYVGMLLPNIPEYLVALQATWLTGATVLQLSPLMVAEEASHWLEATGCHIVVTLDLLAPIVAGAVGKGPLEHLILTTLAGRIAIWKSVLYRFERYRRNGYLSLPEDAHRHTYMHMLDAPPLKKAAEVWPYEDVALLSPTGGTTASPKAVMLTHRNLLCQAMQLRNRVTGPDGAESILGVLPYFHSYGLSVALLSPWAKGSCVHLYPRFDAKAILDLIVTQRPDMVPAVPLMLSALNNKLRGKRIDLSFIRGVISGASALTAPIREEFESHGARNVVEGYGLTEASPVTHVNPDGAGNRSGTIGLPLVDTYARVVNPETRQDVPDGEVGELAVKGPQVMKGYFNNPLATDEVLRDGWLFTGDMVRRDRDGYYTIVDRKRDIIKTGGFLVYPAEVEEVMRSFPGVADAAVVGAPDPDRGEVVKALVVPRAGVTIDVGRLNEHCHLHLGKHKRPKSIEVVTELPKNFLGKVLRRRLREPVAAK